MSVVLKPDLLCPVCNERHPISLAYSYKYPHAVGPIPKEEIEKRIVMTKDQCVIDGSAFYLRGRFAVPVHGVEEPFIWGVWAEVSPKNFIRQQEIWTKEARETEPVFPGYLNNEIPLYGKTIDLKIEIQTKPVGWRPHFFVKDPNHPLAKELRDGLSLERLEEITIAMHHPEA